MEKKNKNIILLFLFGFIILACTDTKLENQRENKINWEDSNAILKAVETYYKDSTVRINRSSLSVHDKRRKRKKRNGETQENYRNSLAKTERMLMSHPRFSARHLLFHRADTANLHLVGKEVAWLPVVMRDKNKIDTLTVDYKVIWDEGTITFIGDGENKIVGAFRVIEVVIQRVNGEKRYEWVEDDGYWEKQLVRDENM